MIFISKNDFRIPALKGINITTIAARNGITLANILLVLKLSISNDKIVSKHQCFLAFNYVLIKILAKNGSVSYQYSLLLHVHKLKCLNGYRYTSNILILLNVLQNAFLINIALPTELQIHENIVNIFIWVTV